jgi:16S rRNA (guanine966-N2)-methyltransferase
MIRIIAGTLKGRTIRFDAERYSADITMQRVKEAFFSIVSCLDIPRTFLDLFSCSGQMAFEAASRGFDPVHCVEHDRARFDLLRRNIESLGLSDVVRVHGADYRRVLVSGVLPAEGFGLVYIDPPYQKVKGEVSQYHDILSSVKDHHVCAAGGIIALQHYAGNAIVPPSGMERVMSRRYGTNEITLLREVIA